MFCFFLRQFRNSRRNGHLRYIIPHRDDQPPPYSQYGPAAQTAALAAGAATSAGDAAAGAATGLVSGNNNGGERGRPANCKLKGYVGWVSTTLVIVIKRVPEQVLYISR